MKKIMITLGFAALALGANAQVKIKDGTAGSTTTVPSNAAILELESAQRGLLLPRVPLSSTTAATLPGGATPVAGLFVYNTATTGNGSTSVFPGMYYYNGNIWVRVIGSASSANDTIVDVNGNLGIGTTSPSQKLDIETGCTAAAPVTGFRLNDGSQGAGKVLSSDANGVASWATPGLYQIQGTLGSGINVTLGATGRSNSVGTTGYTGSYIDLPQGKWKVSVTMLLQCVIPSSLSTGGYVWLRSGFSTSTTTAPSSAFQLISARFDALPYASVSILGTWFYNMLMGDTIITNSSSATTRYYYWAINYDSNAALTGASFQGFGGNGAGENTITAVQLLN